MSGRGRPRDGEGGVPGAWWIRTTRDDKVGCSSSACTDRKGTVTPCPHSLSKHSSEPLAAPIHGRVPPRHTWPARPVRPQSAVKRSAAVEAHRWGPGASHGMVLPFQGPGDPNTLPRASLARWPMWQESPRRATNPQQHPQTRHLRGGPHGALHPERWDGAHRKKLGLLLSEGKTFQRPTWHVPTSSPPT